MIPPILNAVGSSYSVAPSRVSYLIELLTLPKNQIAHNERQDIEKQIQQALNRKEKVSLEDIYKLNSIGYSVSYSLDTINRFTNFSVEGDPELTELIRSATPEGGLLVDKSKMYLPGPGSAKGQEGAAKGFDEIYAIFERQSTEKKIIDQLIGHLIYRLKKYLPEDHWWRNQNVVMSLGCGIRLDPQEIHKQGWGYVSIDNDSSFIGRPSIPSEKVAKKGGIIIASYLSNEDRDIADFIKQFKEAQASDNTVLIFANQGEETQGDRLCNKLPFMKCRSTRKSISKEWKSALVNAGYRYFELAKEAKLLFPSLTPNIREALLCIRRGCYEEPYSHIQPDVKIYKALMEYLASYPLESMQTEEIDRFVDELNSCFTANGGSYLKIINDFVVACPQGADPRFCKAFDKLKKPQWDPYEKEHNNELYQNGQLTEAKIHLSRMLYKTSPEERLGLILRIARISLEMGNYLEAASFLWYIERFANDSKLSKKMLINENINKVEKKLLETYTSECGSYRGVKQAEQDREELGKLRQRIQNTYEPLKNTPPSIEHAKAIQTLYKMISEEIKTFIRTICEDIIVQLEDFKLSLPCDYALIALGSFAKEEITPYSNFEFAILTDRGGDQETKYFQLLSDLLCLRLISLGETLIPKSDNLVQDSFYKTTTLGEPTFNQGMSIICTARLSTKGSSCLIQTPKNNKKKPTEKPRIVISTSSLIAGNQQLLQKYHEQLNEFLCTKNGKNTEGPKKAFELIKNELSYLESNLEEENRTQYRVKRDLYRLPSIMLDALASYYDLKSSSAWETIEELKQKGVLSEEGANNLKILTMTAQEFLLATYLKHGRQQAQLDFDDQKDKLHEIYYIALALAKAMKDFCLCIEKEEDPLPVLKDNPFYQNSPYETGQIYLKLMEYLKAEEAWTGLPLVTADACKLYGNLKITLGKYQEAQEAYKKALEIEPKVDLYIKLSEVYKQLANYKQAETTLFQGLELINKRHPLASARSTTPLNQFVAGYCELELNSEFSRQTTSELVQVLQNLIELYQNMAEFHEAKNCLALYKKLAKKQICCAKKDSYYSVRQSPDLGFLKMEEASLEIDYNPAKAYCLYQIAKKIFITCYPSKDFPALANVYDKLSNLITLSPKKALTYAEKALKIRLKAFGEAHPAIADSYNNIASVLIDHDKHQEALALQKKGLEIRQAKLGEDHPLVANSLDSIGATLGTLGKNQEALEILEKGLKIRQTKLGEDHPLIADSLDRIGPTLRTLGLYKEALESLKKGLKIRQAKFGESHVLVAFSWASVGIILHDSNQQEALAFLKKGLEIAIAATGKYHTHIVDSYVKIACLLAELGPSQEGSDYVQKAFEIGLAIFEKNSFNAAVLSANIGSFYLLCNQFKKATSHFNIALSILNSIPDYVVSRDVIEVHENLSLVYKYSNREKYLYHQNQISNISALLECKESKREEGEMN